MVVVHFPLLPLASPFSRREFPLAFPPFLSLSSSSSSSFPSSSSASSTSLSLFLALGFFPSKASLFQQRDLPSVKTPRRCHGAAPICLAAETRPTPTPPVGSGQLTRKLPGAREYVYGFVETFLLPFTTLCFSLLFSLAGVALGSSSRPVGNGCISPDTCFVLSDLPLSGSERNRGLFKRDPPVEVCPRDLYALCPVESCVSRNECRTGSPTPPLHRNKRRKLNYDR